MLRFGDDCLSGISLVIEGMQMLYNYNWYGVEWSDVPNLYTNFIFA